MIEEIIDKRTKRITYEIDDVYFQGYAVYTNNKFSIYVNIYSKLDDSLIHKVTNLPNIFRTSDGHWDTNAMCDYTKSKYKPISRLYARIYDFNTYNIGDLIYYSGKHVIPAKVVEVHDTHLKIEFDRNYTHVLREYEATRRA